MRDSFVGSPVFLVTFAYASATFLRRSARRKTVRLKAVLSTGWIQIVTLCQLVTATTVKLKPSVNIPQTNRLSLRGFCHAFLTVGAPARKSDPRKAI